MSHFTRRDLLKSSVAASAAAAHPVNASEQTPLSPAAPPAAPSAEIQRERLLLDFGWRFHLGHADDPAQDCAGFQLGQERQYLCQSRNNRSGRAGQLRRQRMAQTRSAARLGHRAAIPERSLSEGSRLPPHRPNLSRHQHRLVPPRIHAASLRPRPPHRPRIRRRISRFNCDS
jgi:hypothetical protein